MFNKQDICLKQETIIDGNITSDAAHIAFAVDDKYIDYIGVAMYSIIKNNPNLSIHFHILTDKISQDNHHRLLQMVPKVGFRVSVYCLNTHYFEQLQTSRYFSTAMYFRMAIPTLLQDVARKVLYLDADTLCLGELNALFALDLCNHAVAAVTDHLDEVSFETYKSIARFGFDLVNPYFNSGVILFDTARWHELDVNAKLKQLIVHIGDKPLHFPDQDLLNIALQGHVRFLSDRYNWVYWGRWPYYLEHHAHNLKIVHFIGSVKPWHQVGFHPLYEQYKQETPWRASPYQLPQQLIYGLRRKNYRITAARLWRSGQKKLAMQYYLQYWLYKMKLGR